MLKKSYIRNHQVFCTTCASPLGDIMLASDGENLLGLWLEGQKYHGDSIYQNMIYIPDSGNIKDAIQINAWSVFEATKDWLNRYFAGKQPAITELSLAPDGSEFRQLIWEYLCQIPYGETTTYGALARQAAAELGKTSMSAQAVGGAVGHNPISIIIPCHRVVGADGSMTGYAGGGEKKIWLLEHEHAIISPII